MKTPARLHASPVVVLLVAGLALASCTTATHTGRQSVISSPLGDRSAPRPSGPSVPSASSPALTAPPSVTSHAAAQPTPVPPPSPAASQPAPATTPPRPAPKPTTKAAAKPATKPPQPAPPPPLLVEQLADVGAARQVVIVTASGWTTDVATLQTFEKGAAGWRAVFPAMAAHIGKAGFSADKHEGDLKTPAGKYGFGTMFGQRSNPAVKFPYQQADSQSVWVDDVKSPYYNTWQQNAALSGEHLASSGYATAYAYAVAIAYNVNPIVPGRGSAIFLHVSTGGGTAGCVSISQSNLLQVLRWLDPAKSPVIVMGPASTVRQY